MEHLSLMKEFLEEPLQNVEDAQTAEAPEASEPAFDGDETIVIPTEPVPAFEDPDQTVIPTDPVVYCNYSNDYGKEIQKTAEEEAALRKKKKDVCLWRTLSKVRTVSNSLLAVEKTKTNHAEPELFNVVD